MSETIKKMLENGKLKLAEHRAEHTAAEEKSQQAKKASIIHAWSALVADLKEAMPAELVQCVYAPEHQIPMLMDQEGAFPLRQVILGKGYFENEPTNFQELFILLDGILPIMFKVTKGPQNKWMLWYLRHENEFYKVPGVGEYVDDDGFYQPILIWNDCQYFKDLEMALAAAAEQYQIWSLTDTACNEKNRATFAKKAAENDEKPVPGRFYITLSGMRARIDTAHQLANAQDDQALIQAIIAISEALYLKLLTPEERY